MVAVSMRFDRREVGLFCSIPIDSRRAQNTNALIPLDYLASFGNSIN
jgi:hypothetical protein